MQSFARAAGRRNPLLLLSGSPAAGRAGLARSINCNLAAAKHQWKSLSSLPLVAGNVVSKATSSPMAAGESGSSGSLRGQRNGRLPRLAPQTAARPCSTISTSNLALDLFASPETSRAMADRDILPEAFKPSHYNLSLYDLEFKNWTYNGTVSIDVAITEPTKELVLNALEIKLSSAKVIVDGKTLSSSDYTYNERAQRVSVAFGEEIPVSAKAQVILEFQGIMNSEMAGFYRSKYKPATAAAPSVPRDDDWHYMLSTQFESCDARRAFPCFDEPNLKATYDFDIEIPDDQVALSNMPVKNEVKTKNGLKKVSFETSPIMSSYLLAWAVGDFEYIEAFTDRKYNGKQIPVRVYTTRGLKEQGDWALQHAPKIIDYFSEIFGIDYPLPKADLIAVHEFTHGAMENWGLVTYRTTQVLYDPKTSDARFLNSVAYVVAHELAHQWFGNLVTMDWWDELWLNEGFATWVGWHAIDHLHPEWQVWAQFVNEGMESAFRLDGIRSSHPIHVPVRDALDVNQIFDHISYLKGCSAIRMLANHLGVETFLKGVSNYLKKYAYGNAKTQALWDALSEASGQDVTALMTPWIGKIGHPVLTVEENKTGDLKIKQNRFLSTGDVKPEEDETIWWVPLGIEGVSGTNGISSLALTSKEDTISGVDTDFYKLNSNATGFFRVAYPPERLAKLGTQLDRLSVEDKITIIGSASELAYAGRLPTSALLSFAKGFKEETNTLVWSQVLDSTSRAKFVFAEDPVIKAGLEKFILDLIDDAVTKIGWEFSEGEGYLQSQLRKRLIGSAVANNHPTVIKEALKRFNQWVEDPSSSAIHPNLRGAVYLAAIKDDPARAVEIIKNEWFNTKSIDGKIISLSSLGSARNVDVIEKTLLPFLFDQSPPAAAKDSVPSADMHALGSSLARNPEGRLSQWKYIQENWDKCLAKLGNPIVVDRFVGVALSGFSDDKYIDEITAFFADKDTSSFNRTLETAKDGIRARSTYKKRDSAALKEWLIQNGFAKAA